MACKESLIVIILLGDSFDISVLNVKAFCKVINFYDRMIFFDCGMADGV